MSNRSKRGTRYLALATGALTGIGVLGLAPTAAFATAGDTISTLSAVAGIARVGGANATITFSYTGLKTSGGVDKVAAIGDLALIPQSGGLPTGTAITPTTVYTNGAVGSAAGSGTATVSVPQDVTGTYSFIGWFDANANGAIDPGEKTTTVSFTTAGAPKTISVTPATQGAPQNVAATYTVTATDANGRPTYAIAPESIIASETDANTSITGPSVAIDPVTGKGTFAATKTDLGTTTLSVAGGGTLTGLTNTATATITTGSAANATSLDVVDTTNTAGVVGTLTPAGTPADTFNVNPTVKSVTYRAKVAAADAGKYVSFAIAADGANPLPAGVSAAASYVKADSSGVADFTVTSTGPLAGTHYVVTAEAGTPDLAFTAIYTAPASVATIEPGASPQTRAYGSSTVFTVTVKDQYGNLVKNELVDWQVAGRNTLADRYAYTDANGQSTFALTDSSTAAQTVGDNDIVTAHLASAGATDDTVTVNYTSQSVAAAAGTLTTTVWNAAGPSYVAPTSTTVLPVDTTRAAKTDQVSLVFAVANTNGTPLQGVAVTFSGPEGSKIQALTAAADPTATVSETATNTVTAYTQADGKAYAQAIATKTGDNSFTATAGSVSDSDTIKYANTTTDARNVAISPEAVSVATGVYNALEATVTDIFGNPVKGVTVKFDETGPGRFASGASEVQGTSDENGMVEADTIAGASETGVETVKAFLDPATYTQADDAADTPFTGAAAASGPATAKVTYGDVKPVFSSSVEALSHAVRVHANITSAPAGSRVTVLWLHDGKVDTILNGKSYDAQSLIGNPAAYWTINPVSSGYAPWLAIRITLANGDYYTSNWNHVAAK